MATGGGKRRAWRGAGLCLALALAPSAARALQPADGAVLPPALALALARGGLALAAPEAAPTPGPATAVGADAPAAGNAAEGVLAAGPAPARAAGEGAPPAAMRRIRATRVAGVGAIMAWGLARWDYGERSLHGGSEGWFGRNTPEGGADKAGHLYTGYVLARGLAALYRNWGLENAAAARQGAWSSLLLTAAMEFGDGFSPYGVSGEDMAMNLAGAWAGQALARSEAWRERVDLRVEYRFNGEARDPLTDYGHARFLVALKPAGFRPWRDTPLRWLELQAGYYARGYADPGAPHRRTAYAGLGLNLPLLFRRAGLERAATFLQFYQPPDSGLRLEDHL